MCAYRISIKHKLAKINTTDQSQEFNTIFLILLIPLNSHSQQTNTQIHDLALCVHKERCTVTVCCWLNVLQNTCCVYVHMNMAFSRQAGFQFPLAMKTNKSMMSYTTANHTHEISPRALAQTHPSATLVTRKQRSDPNSFHRKYHHLLQASTSTSKSCGAQFSTGHSRPSSLTTMIQSGPSTTLSTAAQYQLQSTQKHTVKYRLYIPRFKPPPPTFKRP